MLDHLGDLLRTQVLKKEKELIEKQLKEAERQAEGELWIYSIENLMVPNAFWCLNHGKHLRLP